MYLGIDLGTSGVKLLLLNAQHHIVATADAPLHVQHPQPLWSEQHPADWWAAATQAAQQLRSQAPQAWAQVRAIGLSGQMHGAVVLDAQGHVLRPAMLWNDGRSSAECAALEQAVPHSRRITGNLAMPGFTAPKLLWLRQHEPAVFDRIARVLLPKDWLRLQLTGEAVSDMSDASGTLWLDVGQRAWSPEMLAACGLQTAHMPRLAEGNAVSAYLRSDVAQAWGLPAGIAVAAGAGDNAASAIGVGAVQPGQGFVSLGTSGVIFRISEGFAPAPQNAVHAFAHALPGQWHQMAVMLSAASALAWLAQLTSPGQDAQLNAAQQTTQQTAQWAAQVQHLPPARRAQAPLFLPYLSGERTPHNNPHLSASFIGLQSQHQAVDLAYAVMEGVSFGLLDGWQAMGQRGASPHALAVVGGGARSDAWVQMLASALQCPLHRSPHASVAAALGAARLAAMADGCTPEQACHATQAQAQQHFNPDPYQTPLLLERHARFQSLYRALHST